MIAPGRIWYLVRKYHREGWTTPYWRDRVRPRILRTAPVRTAATGPVEVHCLTSRDDLPNLLWSLKSFYHFARRDYPLVVLEDGSLQDADAATLADHFPDARLVRKHEADAVMEDRLARYPRCREYRRKHPLARKAFDAGCFLEAPRMLLLDSDVLFVSEPTRLIEHAENPRYSKSAFNADIAPALNISAEEARSRFGIELVERINSGIALIRRQALVLEWMEEFLGCPSVTEGHFWRIEQTLLALCASREGAELLPAEYRVSLERGIGGCVAKHYVGAVRHLMYNEGMAELKRRGFLAELEQPAWRAKAT